MSIIAQPTLAAGSFCSEQTLPAGLQRENSLPNDEIPALNGAVVDKWQVVSPLCSGQHSVLYLARIGDGPADTVIKLYPEQHVCNESALRRLKLLRTPHVLRLLAHGQFDNRPFEAMPFMAEGSLEGEKLPEELVIQVVLPQLEQALFQMHQAQLVHNDVKPANLFWKQHSEQLALGDFDCVCQLGTRQKTGGTLAYMAPETLFSGGTIHTVASDYCSMGLTLLALLTGQSPLAGMSEKEVRRAWQKGLHCPDDVSPQLSSLLQSLVRYDPARRPDHAQIQRWLEQYAGAARRQQTKQPAAASASPARELRPLHFKKHVILDIHELVQAAAEDWSYAAFLLRQHQLSDFLLQFSSDNYQLCESCAQTFDPDEGMFRLLQTIEPCKSFCWCGRTYTDLADFACQASQQSPLKADADPVRFLRLGLLRFYLEKNGGTAEQCEFASLLQQQVLEDPDLAITQLLVAMNASPEFQWHGYNFRSLADLADWLIHGTENLDQAVDELFHAKQFEAWLDFIQCGRFIPEVKNRMQEVRL